MRTIRNWSLFLTLLSAGQPWQALASSSDEQAPAQAVQQAVHVYDHQISQEGGRCLAYLEKGAGVSALGVSAAALGTAAAAGAVVAGCILTAPTFIGPFMIGLYGGTFGVLPAGIGTGALIDTRNRALEKGRLLKSSYRLFDLQLREDKKRKDAIARLTKFRDQHVLANDINSTLSIWEVAERFIKGNEAGYYCPASVFAPRGHFSTPGRYADITFWSKPQVAAHLMASEPRDEEIWEFRAAPARYEEFLAAERRAREEAELMRRAADMATN